MPDFDLVVIGSGPAGEKGATQAAYFGKTVAVVEKEPVLGGATANTGTLPSKTLRETALYLSGFRQRGLYGVDFNLKREASVQDLLYRQKVVKETERRRVHWNLSRHGIEIMQGTAAIEDPHTVAVKKPDGSVERLHAKSAILVAVGSSPNRPPLYPFDHETVFDSDELLEMEAIPQTLVVIGGGVIGCEYACMFAALGVNVTLIEPKERLIGFLDGEITELLTQQMRDMGIRLMLGETVSQVDAKPDQITMKLGSGKEIIAREVLVCAGRQGNTAGLGLEKLGIQVDARGRIQVNEHYQTHVPSIYAAGDVIGFPALASTSMEQGRVAVVHAFDLGYKREIAPVLPYGIYTIPEVSMCGATEEELLAKREDYIAGKFRFERNPRGEIIGEKHGMLKLLYRREDLKLLGVHVIGEQASELIHLGLTAMLTGATGELFIQTCFNYPTLSECYKYATYDAMGKRRGKPSF